MKLHQAHWAKTIFWGVATAALYTVMFSYSDLVLHLAHTTPDACIVDQGGATLYYHKADAAACAAKGGRIEPGVWWHVLLPILLAFAVSIVHGAFTGLFWEAMGLKPAARAEAKE